MQSINWETLLSAFFNELDDLFLGIIRLRQA
jgi:hypothetical protein